MTFDIEGLPKNQIKRYAKEYRKLAAMLRNWKLSKDSALQEFEERLAAALKEGYPIDFSADSYRIDFLAPDARCKEPLLIRVIKRVARKENECVNLLLNYGADVNATDANGNNCLAVACTQAENSYTLNISTFKRIVSLTNDVNAGYNYDLPVALDMTLAGVMPSPPLKLLAEQYIRVSTRSAMSEDSRDDKAQEILFKIYALIDAEADLSCLENFRVPNKRQGVQEACEQLKTYIANYIERRKQIKPDNTVYYDYEL